MAIPTRFKTGHIFVHSLWTICPIYEILIVFTQIYVYLYCGLLEILAQVPL